MNNKLSEFIEAKLIPELHHSGMADAFPNMGFTKKGNKWGAPYYLNGTPHTKEGGRWDKIYTTSAIPHIITEQGGESMSLIKFHQQRTGKSYIESVRALSEVCGLTMPEREESEKEKKFRELQEGLQEINNKMRKDLFSDEGAATLRYLKEERKYDEGFIDFAEFGYCSPQTAQELRKILNELRDMEVIPTSCPSSVGVDNVLAIPYRTGSRIQGFVFRTIAAEGEGKGKGKYMDVFISQKATKQYNLFGLTGLSLTGNPEKDKDITIVEGEIDALRAKYAGVENVVAASGGNVYPEALKEAKRRGVKRVTILFDYEATEEAQQALDGKILKAISAIRGMGLEPFVASFGKWENSKGERQKMDVDSYLRTISPDTGKPYTGEDLRKLIKYGEVLEGSLWELYKIYDKFDKVREADGEEKIAPTEQAEFRDQVLALLKKTPKREDKDRIFNEYSILSYGVLSEESLREEEEKDLQEKQRQQALSEVSTIADEIKELHAQGKLQEAIEMGKRLSDLSEKAKETKFSKYLKPFTLTDAQERYKSKPSGIRTGYYFGEEGKQEELILQASALTYICAPTSHGKTTFLENLALRTAQSRDEEGDVVFITFEEPEEDVATEFLTLFIGKPLMGKPLSDNVLRSIRSYYKEEKDYFRGEGVEAFLKAHSEFNEMLERGELRICSLESEISELIGFIKYIVRERKVKAVFVDYIQLIQHKGIKGGKKDAIENICDELRALSISAKLPIVLGAQLNRDVLSPVDSFECQRIADASNIEHSANTIVLLWNSDTMPRANNTYFVKNKKGDKGEREFSEEAKRIEEKGFNIGKAGTLYALLAKNRGGQRNLSAVFKFEGNIRAITQLYPSPDKNRTAKPTTPRQPERSLFTPEDDGTDY